MLIKTIVHTSNEYEEMVKLRISALLEPIGVSASYIDKEKEKNDCMIGAFKENKLVGCCVLTRIDAAVIQLRQMAVDPAWQGKGIGSAIINFAEKTACLQGFLTLRMHARNPVIEFYKKCGYEISGDEFYEVGIAHHQMQKKLSIL